MEILIGAAVFAVGCLFGAWLVLAGQQSKTNRTGQKLQSAILERLEKGTDGRENS